MPLEDKGKKLLPEGHASLESSKSSLLSQVSIKGVASRSTISILSCGFTLVLEFLRRDAGILTCALPYFQFFISSLQIRLELVYARAELRDGLFREKLFERPLFYVLRFVLL